MESGLTINAPGKRSVDSELRRTGAKTVLGLEHPLLAFYDAFSARDYNFLLHSVLKETNMNIQRRDCVESLHSVHKAEGLVK